MKRIKERVDVKAKKRKFVILTTFLTLIMSSVLYADSSVSGSAVRRIGSSRSVKGSKISFPGETSNEDRISAGTKKVGIDIPSGEYVLYASGSVPYFSVSSDSNGENIIFNDLFSYNSIVTVNEGEYLKLQNCYGLPIDKVEDIDLGKSGSMYKVGTHIPAGEYKILATGGTPYYCIYSDSRHDYIVSNDLFENDTYVTVSNGQYLKLQDCTFETVPTKPLSTEDIKSVQEALNAHGNDCGTPDGIAGEKTRGAVEKYQEANELPVTGVIDEDLMEKLLGEQ